MNLLHNFSNAPFGVVHKWGYVILFLATITEAIPFFGSFIPGQTLLLISGFFSKLGALNFWYVFIIAAVGAIFGDFMGYLLGRGYGHPFILKYGKYFFLNKKNYERTRTLLTNNTGKTLILGRLYSVTRAFVPFAAGAIEIPYKKFLTFNIIGGICWAFAFTTIGYIFGRSYQAAARYFTQLVLLAILASLFMMLVYKKMKKEGYRFTKYHGYALVLNILSLYVFSKMAEDVINKEVTVIFDGWISSNIVYLWDPFLTKAASFLTSLANPISMIILSVALFILLLYNKRKYFAYLLAWSVACGFISEYIIKLIVQRARPSLALINVGGYSFPSGHATLAIIFFSVLIYTYKDSFKSKLARYLYVGVNIALFLLIGFSRIYLNVHWFSDVVGGWALGLFWLTFFIIIFAIVRNIKRKRLDLGGFGKDI